MLFDKMASFKGPAIVAEAEKVESVSTAGLVMAILTCLEGSARRFFSPSLVFISPGINFILMTSSSGWNKVPKSGVDLALYDHSEESPWVNTECAACGCVLAIIPRHTSSEIHWLTLFFAKDSTKALVPIDAPR